MLRVLNQDLVAAPDAGQMYPGAGRRQRLQQQIAVGSQVGLVQRTPRLRQPAIVAPDLRDDILVLRVGRQLPPRNALWKP